MIPVLSKINLLLCRLPADESIILIILINVLFFLSDCFQLELVRNFSNDDQEQVPQEKNGKTGRLVCCEIRFSRSIVFDIQLLSASITLRNTANGSSL